MNLNRTDIAFFLLFVFCSSSNSNFILADQSDYPGAEWIPSPPQKFTARTVPITEIVIHTIEDGQNPPSVAPGTLQPTIDFLQNSINNLVSVHYLVGQNC